MKRRKDRHISVPRKSKRTIEDYIANFNEKCEFCDVKLEVIKHRPKSDTKREVVAATCQNKNHKGNKCPMWCVEIRFIESYF